MPGTDRASLPAARIGTVDISGLVLRVMHVEGDRVTDRHSRGGVRMGIQPKQPTSKAPAEMFTGDVWVDRIVTPEAPSRLSVGSVHFAPGARSAWHSHTLGQVLYVTEGEGWVQSRGEPIVVIRAGDVVRTPPEEWHWHGAGPNHFMTHLSLTEGEAHWGDHVTDDEYHGHEQGHEQGHEHGHHHPHDHQH